MPAYEGSGNRLDPRNFSRTKLPRYNTHFSSVLRPGARAWGAIERYYNPTTTSAAPRVAKRKVFQYNPAEVAYSINASQASPGSDFTPGSINATLIAGNATFSLSLFFEREREAMIAAADPIAGGPDAKIPPHKGVLVDIDDLYDLLLDQQAGQAGSVVTTTPTDVADQGSGPAEGTQSLNISDASLNAFWGTVFVSVPVLVRFNPALAFAGWATDMQITFNKFNAQLMPVFATVQMGFVIMSATTAQVGASIAAGTATPPTTGTGTSPSILPGNTQPTTPTSGNTGNLNPGADRSAVGDDMALSADSRYVSAFSVVVETDRGNVRALYRKQPQIQVNRRYSRQVVAEWDRIELITAVELNSATLWWIAADINPHFHHPDDLVPGELIRVPVL